jgi:competence protein ComEC
MRVWFLNVGHGDCTIIEHPSGRITMVDINNSQDYDPGTRLELLSEVVSPFGAFDMSLLEQAEKRELDCPVTFFKQTFADRPLFRFVLTHPDLDHMRGLKNLFEQVRVENFWDTENTKPTPQFRSQADVDDWYFYQDLRAGRVAGVSVCRFLQGHRSWALNQNEDGSLGGDGIYIVSPDEVLLDECNRKGAWNDSSITLWIKYGDFTILLPGDAEHAAWDCMTKRYRLQSTVLKASHHGRDSGFDLAAVKAVNPMYVVVSVGRKPATDAHRKYAHHCSNVYSTRYYGRLELDAFPDGTCQWYAARNAGK